MKTVILGSKGMLGYELDKVFSNYDPILLSKDDLDITDKDRVKFKINELKPELIINAAAYTGVDGAEENEELATKTNGHAVGYIVEASSKINATLVHFSTDYVFDGSKKQGYTEYDKPNPINAYGRSKLAGENEILRFPPATTAGRQDDKLKYYIIRTSWLYGEHGKNFVDTMLSLSKKGELIKVVDDQFGSPTYTIDLALATRQIIEDKRPSGIYHRTNSGITSWYDFTKEIFNAFDVKTDVAPCASNEFPRPAKRPKYSILKSTKLPEMRPWQEALQDYKSNQ